MKKLIVILTAVVMMVPVFTGCSKGKNDEGITKLANAVVGDKVYFGKYEQDNNKDNGKEQITWIVLAAEDGKALLISEKVLDAKKYNEEQIDITWETCTLRKWLNEDFLKSAFKSSEKRAIVETNLTNKSNPKYGTPGGNDTKDKIFMFSFDEAEKYLINVEAYRALGTKFAESNGLMLSSGLLFPGNSGWWLRSPGYYPYDAGYVNYDGLVYNELYVNYANFGIRPVIWVKQ